MTTLIHPYSMRMANVFLLENEQGLMLIDAGMPGDEQQILRFINQTSRKELRLIFITHAHLDHYGALGRLSRATGAPVAIHRADTAAMSTGETGLGSPRGRGVLLAAIFPLVRMLFPLEPVKADLIADDGQDLTAFGFPARIIHTPGHTPGSSTLLLEEHIAFVGDLLTNSGEPRLQRYFADDWTELESSFWRLISLEPHKIYTGHGRNPINHDQIRTLSKGW